MKRTLFCIVALLLFSQAAFSADKWSNGDIAREAVYLVLHTVDWKQTRYVVAHPDEYHETNPILGKYPSKKRVDAHFATTALMHVAAVNFMPEKWRPVFQYLSIGVEAGYVGNNYRIGIRTEF